MIDHYFQEEKSYLDDTTLICLKLELDSFAPSEEEQYILSEFDVETIGQPGQTIAFEISSYPSFFEVLAYAGGI